MVSLNVDMKTRNINVQVKGHTLDIQSEAIQGFVALVDAVAEVRHISFDSAALLVYQIGVSTHSECLDIWEKGKSTTWEKNDISNDEKSVSEAEGKHSP